MAVNLGQAVIRLLADPTPLLHGLDKASAGMGRFAGKAKLLSAKFASAGKAISGLGTKMLGFAAIVGGIGVLVGKKLVGDFAKFEQQLIESQTIAGQTTELWKSVRALVQEVALATKFDPQQIADGIRLLASAGLKTREEMEPTMKAATALASAIGTDLPTAIGLTISGMAAFTVTTAGAADEMERAMIVADELRNIQGAARIEAQDLAKFMETVGGAIAGMNLNSKEALAIFGAVNQTMGNGARAAVGLRQGIVMLNQAMEKKVTRKILLPALKRIGMTMNEISPEVVGLQKAFENLDKAGIATAQMSKVLGMEGHIMFMNWQKNEKTFRRIRKEMDATGTAIAAETKNLDTFQGRWDVLKGSLQLMRIELGKVVSEAVAPLIKTMLVWVNDVAIPWIKNNSELIRQWIVSAAKIIAWTAAIGATLLVVGKLIGVIGGLIFAVSTAATAVKGLIAVFTFLAAHPIVLAIGAIAAAIFLVVKATQQWIEFSEDADRVQRNLLETEEKRQKVEDAHIERLQELAEKEKLNSVEMREAKQLIEELTTKYGDLGISIDKTTDKLIVEADAWEDVNKKQQAVKLEKIEAAMVETRVAMEKWQKELEKAPLADMIKYASELRDEELDILIDLYKKKAALLKEGVNVEREHIDELKKIREQKAVDIALKDEIKQAELALAHKVKLGEKAISALIKLEEKSAAKIRKIQTTKFDREIEDLQDMFELKKALAERVMLGLESQFIQATNRIAKLRKKYDEAKAGGETLEQLGERTREIDIQKEIAETLIEEQRKLQDSLVQGEKDTAGAVKKVRENEIKNKEKQNQRLSEKRLQFELQQQKDLLRVKKDRVALAKLEAKEMLKIATERIERIYKITREMTQKQIEQITRVKEDALRRATALSNAHILTAQKEARGEEAGARAKLLGVEAIKSQIKTWKDLKKARLVQSRLENSALVAAQKADKVESALAKARERGASPAAIKRLETLAKHRRDQANKRAEEAGSLARVIEETFKKTVKITKEAAKKITEVGASITESTTKTHIEAVGVWTELVKDAGKKVSETSKIIVDEFTKSTDVVRMNMELFVEDAQLKGIDAVEGYLEGWRITWPKLESFVRTKMKALRKELEPSTKHSPSLIEVMDRSVAVVASGVRRMGTKLTDNAPNLSPVSNRLSAAYTSMSGVGPVTNRTLTDNRQLNMDVRTSVDSQELIRKMQHHFRNTRLGSV